MLHDDALARAFVRRAPGALAEAYRRHAAILVAVARGTLGNANDAEDCVHDVVVRVWFAADSYRLERGTLRAYLIVCVRNEALSRKRAAARRSAIDLREALAETAAESIDERDYLECRRLRDALRTLPAEQRRVVELAYFGDRSQSEIARELDLPLGTVKGRAAAALRKLSLALVRRNLG